MLNGQAEIKCPRCGEISKVNTVKSTLSATK